MQERLFPAGPSESPYMALYLRHAARRAVVDGARAVQPGPMVTGPSAEAVQLLTVRRRPQDARRAASSADRSGPGHGGSAAPFPFCIGGCG